MAALQGIIPLIQVGNMRESLDYYCEVLGFALEEVWPEAEDPRWARVSRGGAQFLLTMDLGTSDRPFIAEKGNGVVFYIPCEDLGALYEEFSSKGAIIVQEPVPFGGRWQFTVADINGYVLTFSEPFGRAE